jgi:hypothetical protein
LKKSSKNTQRLLEERKKKTREFELIHLRNAQRAPSRHKQYMTYLFTSGGLLSMSPMCSSRRKWVCCCSWCGQNKRTSHANPVWSSFKEFHVHVIPLREERRRVSHKTLSEDCIFCVLKTLVTFPCSLSLKHKQKKRERECVFVCKERETDRDAEKEQKI